MRIGAEGGGSVVLPSPWVAFYAMRSWMCIFAVGATLVLLFGSDAAGAGAMLLIGLLVGLVDSGGVLLRLGRHRVVVTSSEVAFVTPFSRQRIPISSGFKICTEGGDTGLLPWFSPANLTFGRVWVWGTKLEMEFLIMTRRQADQVKKAIEQLVSDRAADG